MLPSPLASQLKSVQLPDGSSRQVTEKDVSRIWPRVEVDTAGCWIWTGLRYPTGYGRTSIGSCRSFYTHRLMYMVYVGVPAAGLHIDHLCRVRECCNPQHLEAVTPRENYRRAPAQISTINASKTACIRGHELSGDNVRVDAQGRRTCRACKRLKWHMTKKIVRKALPTECTKGHPFDEANTYYAPSGKRYCRTCKRALQRAWRTRQAAK